MNLKIKDVARDVRDIMEVVLYLFAMCMFFALASGLGVWLFIWQSAGQ